MQEIKETSYRISLRDKILDAALKAFAENGIRAVKMDDIATMLGISKRTLYELYKDKEEVVFQSITKYYKERRKDRLDYAGNHNVMDIILYSYSQKAEESQNVCLQFYIDIQKYPRIVAYLEENHRQSRENLRLFLLRGVKEGYFREDVNYDILPSLFDAIEQYIQKNELYRSYSLRDLFSNMLLVPLRGFCTEKGLKVLEEAKF